ncbi:MAG TPA: LysM peptidoglycan-binding domain-containing protein [Longimicrobiaceae bacterium]|jgi:membrane-bound lytic murein transglycosylase D
MYPFRPIPALLLAALAGCASGEAMVASAPAAPVPETVAPVDTLPPAPPAEPDAPLEERWAAPFAVQSVGQLAARDPRPAVVRLAADSAPKPAAPDTVPLAAVPVDTASARPAAPARPRADSARTAARPPRPAPGGSAAGTSTRSGARRSHEVKPGETFYGVARRYEVTPAALRAANPGVDPETLRSGTTLWIPGAAAASSSSAPKSGESRTSGGGTSRTAGAGSRGTSGSGSSSTARAGRRTHKVVSGDTLFGIARKYGVSAAAIRSANKLEDDTVELGATLVIPAS